MIRSADNCELLYCYYDSWPHSSSCFANFNYAPTSLKLKISIEDNSAKTSFNNMLLIFPELINLVGLECFWTKIFSVICTDCINVADERSDFDLIFSSWSSTKSCSSTTGSSRLKIYQNRTMLKLESLLFSTGFLPKTVFCSMKTIRPKKYLWKWSRVLLNVTALKKKGEDAPGYVWAQQLHPLTRRAVSWKD